MRTRIYNKMTTPEIEEYLARGGDTIFIACGVVEAHGNMPVDCETIYPEAVAKLLAEKADGLAMINLPYFYPGGTVISNVTVHLSIFESVEYLMKIGHSLVDQGFKRIFLTSGHGPSGMYINIFCREFFEETLIHPCHITSITASFNGYGAPRAKMDPETAKKASCNFYGAYKVMDQMDYLAVDPNLKEDPSPRIPQDPVMARFAPLARGYGGPAALIFSDPKQHSGGVVFKSEEERLEACTLGEEYLLEQVAQSPICELKEALGEYQDYVQRCYKLFPRIKRTW